MDIPYKGYTIIPNSERQPDGRWLPVAELEASSRGVVTPKPPLRALPREIKATRADADALAVKMAKAWIEAIERQGDEPRVEEARLPEARVKAPPRARRVEAEKPATTDTLDWPRLHEIIGDRLTRLLAIHSLLDRLVTLALARKLAGAGDVEPVLHATASLPLSSRVALAVTANAIPPATAESILEIDGARHRFVHAKPTRGRPAWDLGGAVESAPQDVHDRTLCKGLEAAQGLMAALRTAAPEG